MEIQNNFYIENTTFETFNTMNAQLPRIISTFNFLTYAPRAQVNIFLILKGFIKSCVLFHSLI